MNYCDPEGFKNELREIRKKGKDTFFSWFDGGETVDGAYEKAEGIFCRLMLPFAERHLGDLSDKISLDIGYGGGGQVFAASEHFKYATGIDVHNEISFVEAELRKRQGGENKNTALFMSNGDTIPMDNNSIDFIHSWVTFLHLGTIQVVDDYLKEMFRVMRPGGVAVIFFTRLCRSKKVQNMSEYVSDIKTEEQHLPGYREGGPLTRVNKTSIVISRWKMVELVKKHGFKYLLPTFSHDKEKIYGQHGVVFQKPKKKKFDTRKKKPIIIKAKKGKKK